ncbi:MAG: hypothetical protein KDA24_15665 [Deltaproteobacteria bacterium]|nr:hypothetical protein [Deltaproteobacteria bacterium]
MRRLFVFVLLFVGCGDPVPEPAQCSDLEVLDDAGACVSPACGTGTWGDNEPHPTEPTLYVLASAESPGDGSAESPFPRINTALEAAVEVTGGRVLIGAGRYLDHLSFNRAHDGLELVGRCAELSIVDGEGLAGPTLSIFASSVVVRDLTITGGRPGIIAGEVPGAPGLVLRGNGLWIQDNGGYGVLATGGGVLVDLAESLVRDIRPTNVVSPARGIGVEQSARLVGVGLDVQGVEGIGVQVLAGSQAELDDSLVRAAVAQSDGTYGRGLHVEGGELVLRRTVVQAQPERGADVGAGGTLSLEDSTIEAGSQHAARVTGGGRLLAERSTVRAPRGLGVQVLGNNSYLELANSAVTSSLDADQGPLVSVEAGAALLATGSSLELGFGRALHLAGDGSAGSLVDTDVRDTHGDSPDFAPGIGILVSDGADFEGDDVGVDGATGPGLFLARDATARCTSCLVDRATFAAAMVTGGAELRLESGQLRGTVAHPLQQGGVGALGVGTGNDSTVLRIDDTGVLDMEHAGVAVSGPGSWRVASALVETSGLGSAAPGLLAMDGTTFWQGPAGPGLFVFDVTFRQLPNDAILLDGATATISGSSFDGVGQLEVYTQNCGAVLPPDVAEEVQSNDCAGPPRVLGPPLSWPAPPLALGVLP